MTSSSDPNTPEIVAVDAATTAFIHGVVPMTEIREFFDRAYPTLGRVLGEQGVNATGAYALYHGMPTDSFDLDVGLLTDRPVAASADVQSGTLPAGRVARVIHVGNYDRLGQSWGALGAWVAESGHRPGNDVWEVYLTEPGPDVDPEAMRTELNWPLLD